VAGNNHANFVIERARFPEDNRAQFFVIISNGTSVITSEVATVTVQQDLTPPAILSAVGDLDLARMRLTFSEQLDLSSVTATSFTLFETGSDPESSPYVTFTADSSDGTNVDLLTDARELGRNYSVQIRDVRDASSGNNLVNPNPTIVPLATRLLLIGFDVNNEWKYDINNGDRTGTGWEQLSFDDSAWPLGIAGLGFDSLPNEVPIRTSLPYLTNSAPVYLRRRFFLPPVNGLTLSLRDVVDDGAIYYLNGQEAFRHNVGTGMVTYATRAISQFDPTPIQGPFNLPTTNVVAGDNALAALLLQSGGASGDMMFAAELVATIARFADSSLQMSRTANNSVRLTLSGQPGSINRIESAPSLAPPVVWTLWQTVTLTNLFQELPAVPIVADAQFFRVVRE
jgi:hypothetical protein